MTDREHEARRDERPSTGETAGSTAVTPVDAAPGTVTGPSPSGEGPEDARRDEPGWLALIGDPDRFATRWDEIETAFVDDPRRAVEDADRLVGDIVQALTDSLSETRSALRQQWGEGSQVGTEDLRLTLQRYRSFLNRLLPG